MTYSNLIKLNLKVFSVKQIQHVLAKNVLGTELVPVFCRIKSARQHIKVHTQTSYYFFQDNNKSIRPGKFIYEQNQFLSSFGCPESSCMNTHINILLFKIGLLIINIKHNTWDCFKKSSLTFCLCNYPVQHIRETLRLRKNPNSILLMHAYVCAIVSWFTVASLRNVFTETTQRKLEAI